MMPNEENILWFGVRFFTVFMGFLISWPFNEWLICQRRKVGLMQEESKMRHLWLPLGGLLLATFGIAAIIVWYNDTLLVGRSNNREPCRGRPTAECWSFPAEQMYSDPTITLYTMWTMFGVALGVATIGVGTILIARPRAEVAQKQAPPKEHA